MNGKTATVAVLLVLGLIAVPAVAQAQDAGATQQDIPHVSDAPALTASTAPPGKSEQPASAHVSDAPAPAALSAPPGKSQQEASTHVSAAPGTMTTSIVVRAWLYLFH